MLSFSNIIIFLLLLTAVSYLIGIFLLINKFNEWIKKSVDNSDFDISEEAVSVVIPLRNESHAIENILNCLANQEYQNFEVLLVDDHSEDDTAKKIASFIATKELKHFRYLKLPENSKGKKAALRLGVSNSAYDIIITTDADCTMGRKWLQTLNREFTSNRADLLGGPVKQNGNPFFNLEFLALQIVGYVLGKLDMPTYCNWANLMFRKSLFEAMSQTDYREDEPSGDDVFLLHFANRNNAVIFFTAEKTALVETQAPANIKAFVQQRIRWASKTKKVKSYQLRLLAVSVFLEYTLYLASLILGFLQPHILIYLAIAIFCKSIFDGLLLKKASRIYEMSFALPVFVISELLFPLYIFFVGVLSLIKTYTWKGRNRRKMIGNKNFKYF